METNLAKIAIQRGVDEQIEAALKRVNDGFNGGRVTKTDFTSWLLMSGIRNFDESAVEEVRRTHFNQVAYLQGLLKQVKQAGRSALTDEEVEKVQDLVRNTGAGKVRRSKKYTGSEKDYNAVSS